MIKRIPGYQFRDLGPDGGPYDDMSNPKVLLHTTEGSSIAGAEAAFKNYPPHLCYDPRYRGKRQYVSLDRHSYALKGSEADDEFIIQVEIVGFAQESHTWNNDMYRNIALDVIEPLRNAIGVPLRYRRFYRAGENGYILASPNSPIRMTLSQLRTFSGFLGHQHAPYPDAHWDPGGFLMDKAMSFLPDDSEKQDPTIQEMEMSNVAYVRGDSEIPIPNSNNVWGDVVFLAEWDAQEGVARARIVSPNDPGLKLWEALGRKVIQVPQAILDAVPGVTIEPEAVVRTLNS